MRTSRKQIRRKEEALTLVEVLVVLAVLGMSIYLFLNYVAYQLAHSVRINCPSNLKQVGLAFRIWEGDNNDHYPMSFYTNAQVAPLYSNAQDAFHYFQVMSNELNNPKVLFCPDDKQRRAATNFTTDFNGSHISYFIGLDADDSHPQRFLAGDSNLTNGTKMVDGILTLTTNRPTSWTKERHGGFGNVVMADGSVQQLDKINLRKAVENTGLTTNRLLMP